MAKVVQAPDGALWEERGGKWYEVSSARAGGLLQGADLGVGMGASEAVLDEFRRLGAGIHSTLASVIGDKDWQKRIRAERGEQEERVRGLYDAASPGVQAAMTAGRLAPSLATIPVGLGIGGLATRGGMALAEQVALGAGMGGMGYSGDQGMDAMTGALLSAGGWGTGQLAGKVMGAIGARGERARAAIVEGAGGASGPGSLDIVGRADEITAAAAGRGGAGMPGGGGQVLDASGNPLHLGQAVAPVAQRVSQGVELPGMVAVQGATGLTEEGARMVARAKELGLQLTPGAKTGDRAQQMLEASAKSSPWGARFFEPLRRNNEQVLNRAAVAALGEEGNAVTQQVLNNAHLRLGEVFEGVGRQIGVVGGDALEAARGRLDEFIAAGRTGGEITPEAVAAAKKLQLAMGEEGTVSGKRLLSERSSLVQLSRDYSGQSKGLAAQGVRQLVEVVDDLMESAIPKANQAAVRGQLREARGQWRILSSLESGSAVRPDGGVAAGVLFRNLEREFPMEMRRGNFATEFGNTATGARARDLMDTVRITQSFRDVVSDSGTATRMSLQGFIDSPVRALLEAAIYGGGSKLYLQGGGLMAHEVLRAQNAAPGASGLAGGIARGIMGF